MIIEGSKNSVFLQFKKYISNEGVFLEFSFPKAKWSDSYYDRLESYLISNEIRYKIKKGNEESQLDFIDIYCSTDVEFCVFLVKEIFVNVFDYDENELMYKIKYYNVSPKDEKIGF